MPVLPRQYLWCLTANPKRDILNAMNEYNETESFPTEIFDINTLKLLDMVCEGVDVPSDEDIEEAAIAHGEKEEV